MSLSRLLRCVLVPAAVFLIGVQEGFTQMVLVTGQVTDTWGNPCRWVLAVLDHTGECC